MSRNDGVGGRISFGTSEDGGFLFVEIVRRSIGDVALSGGDGA